jgi:hypothetical protein
MKSLIWAVIWDNGRYEIYSMDSVDCWPSVYIFLAYNVFYIVQNQVILSWESITAFGSPVVPLVYTRLTHWPGLWLRTLCMTSSSSIYIPKSIAYLQLSIYMPSYALFFALFFWWFRFPSRRWWPFLSAILSIEYNSFNLVTIFDYWLEFLPVSLIRVTNNDFCFAM